MLLAGHLGVGNHLVCVHVLGHDQVRHDRLSETDLRVPGLNLAGSRPLSRTNNLLGTPS